MEYREPEYEYEDQQPEYEQPKKHSEMGLKIAIVILIVVLGAVTWLYFNSMKVSDADKAALQIEMDTLQSQAQRLTLDLDGMKFDNDTLNRNLQTHKFKADSLMERLKKERSMSYTKIKQYERELGTLRVTLKGFVRQIDSLHRLNEKLAGENLAHKREISNLRLKTEVAEETAQELNLKVQRGSQVKIGKISVSALNKSNKESKNAKQTARLVISFDLTANELAQVGERNVFVRIISPEGYDLSESQSATFSADGQRTPYAARRAVDYQGDNLPVSVYYNSSSLTSGTYTIYVYIDGSLIGSTVINLK